MILLIVITLFTSLFIQPQLVSTPVYGQSTNGTPDAISFAELACNAYDGPSLKKCLEQIPNSDLPIIRIAAPIICESSDQCSFVIKNVNQRIEISASNPANKITRIKNFGYTLFSVENSSNIHFKNLTIEDQSNKPCLIGISCPPIFNFTNSKNLSFENMTFTKTIGTSLLIKDSEDISIISSNFRNSWKNALEIRNQKATQGIKVISNLFENNSGSAIIFQASSIDQNSSSISKNKLINNHSGGVYSADCSYPCIASQIQIVGPTVNLSIAQNLITGGINSVFDNLGFYVSGVEVDNKSITNVELSCNEINNNRGSGIVQSALGLARPSVSNILPGGVIITLNKIWGNGLQVNTPASPPVDDNCYDQKCVLVCN